MNIIKNNWKNLLISAGIVFGMLYFLNPKIEEVEVPVRIEVKVPVIEKVHDTIEKPVPYKVLVDSPVNEQLRDSLSEAKSVIDSLRAYKAFTVKRQYTQSFDDETQTITVFAETTGTLDKLQASYKTKPKTILLDTVLTIKVPKYNKFFGGISVGVPVNNNIKPIFKADLYLKTKNNNLWNISFDTQRIVWIGHAWEF